MTCDRHRERKHRRGFLSPRAPGTWKVHTHTHQSSPPRVNQRAAPRRSTSDEAQVGGTQARFADRDTRRATRTSRAAQSTPTLLPPPSPLPRRLQPHRWPAATALPARSEFRRISESPAREARSIVAPRPQSRSLVNYGPSAGCAESPGESEGSMPRRKEGQRGRRGNTAARP